MNVVLVINDNPQNLVLITIHLLKLGCQVAAVCSDDAMEAAHALHPRLILVDYVPEDREDDLSLIERIKCTEPFIHTPLVVFSSRAHSDNANAVLAAGADEYIGKPYDVDQIREITEKYLA